MLNTDFIPLIVFFHHVFSKANKVSLNVGQNYKFINFHCDRKTVSLLYRKLFIKNSSIERVHFFSILGVTIILCHLNLTKYVNFIQRDLNLFGTVMLPILEK